MQLSGAWEGWCVGRWPHLPPTLAALGLRPAAKGRGSPSPSLSSIPGHTAVGFAVLSLPWGRDKCQHLQAGLCSCWGRTQSSRLCHQSGPMLSCGICVLRKLVLCPWTCGSVSLPVPMFWGPSGDTSRSSAACLAPVHAIQVHNHGVQPGFGPGSVFCTGSVAPAAPACLPACCPRCCMPSALWVTLVLLFLFQA